MTLTFVSLLEGIDEIMINQIQNKRRHRIVFLDSLRFLAAAAVVLQHVVEQQGPVGEAITRALSPGIFGVALFFIISGTVIPMAANEHFNIRKFALLRIFRIYPLVLATFAILYIGSFAGMLPSYPLLKEASSSVWIANLLLVQDYIGEPALWGVTWTLSLEFAWYAIFAISTIIIGPRFDCILIVAAPIILVALAVLSIVIDHRLPLARLGMIYAAILGTRIYRNHVGILSHRRLLLDIAVFLLVMAASNFVAFGYFRHPNMLLSQALYPWLVAPVIFAVVALVPSLQNHWVLNNFLFGWLGKISFSTYLLHPLAISLAQTYASNNTSAILSICFTVALSVVGYYLIEVPGNRLGYFICKL